MWTLKALFMKFIFLTFLIYSIAALQCKSWRVIIVSIYEMLLVIVPGSVLSDTQSHSVLSTGMRKGTYFNFRFRDETLEARGGSAFAEAPLLIGRRVGD